MSPDTDEHGNEFKLGSLVRIKGEETVSVVIGFEQGNCTVQLPVGITGTTWDFWPSQLEWIKQLPVGDIYYVGRKDGREEMRRKEEQELRNDVAQGFSMFDEW